jgi:hypothetical protein
LKANQPAKAPKQNDAYNGTKIFSFQRCLRVR